MVVLGAKDPFTGSMIPTIIYSIVLFTITGVSDNCEEATISLFAFFGIGVHCLVAIFSFAPKDKEMQKEAENSDPKTKFKYSDFGDTSDRKHEDSLKEVRANEGV